MTTTDDSRRSTPTRREVLAAAGLGALGLATGAGRATAASVGGRQRITVIGGGVAGVAAAWLLDGEHDVTLLEAGPELGGHARSVDVTSGGATIAVDGGAQYFSPRTHPIYTQLLDQVLHVPTVSIRMDYTVWHYGAAQPVMVSPNPPKRLLSTLQPAYWPALQAMAVLIIQGMALERRQDWTPTVAEFVEPLWIPREVKDAFVYPFFGSLTGSTIEDAKAVSARAALAFVVRVLGDNPLTPFEYFNATDGLRAVISAMSDEFTTVKAHVNSPATRLYRQGDTYRIERSDGQVHTADHVVLALPPHTAGPLVRTLPDSGPIAATYARFPYFPVQISIHRDPVYMPADPATWSAFNATVDGQYCEATMSYGIMRGVEVYKSWTVNRREEPRDLVTTFDYRHPLMTPDSMLAQRRLHALQGQDRLWFVGSHVYDVDSQESALFSAIRVADALAPNSANRARLGTLPDSPAQP